MYINARNDTLIIRVGSSDGFSGNGVKMRVIKNAFTTELYSYDDVIVAGDTPPKQQIENQQLTLNTNRYASGDSLYGRVYARINESDGTKTYISGFFRTRVGDADL